jgi:hypothetical protein
MLLLATEKYAQLILEGAYVDTKFGTSSFTGRSLRIRASKNLCFFVELQDLEPQTMLLRKEIAVSLTVSSY